MSVTTKTKDEVSIAISPQASERGSYTAPRNEPEPVWRLGMARVTRRLLVVAPPIILAIILLVSWYLGTTVGQVSSLILPAPGGVFASLRDGLASGLFLSNAIVTIEESIFGFLLALIVALPLGYGLAKSRLISVAVQPYLAAGQAVPAIVIAPFLIFWLGSGLIANTILCALIVLFPMVITTVLGMRTIDKALTDAARVEGAGGLPLLLHIEFPLALPAVLAGIRTSLTLSVTGALVGEFVGGGNLGLGALVQIAKEQYNIELMFATIIVLAVLAALYYGAAWLLTKLAEAIYY
ncbi:MAG TPA: ABC transporter permease [Ktedonobacteraceae bacterium]|nr:ABC transporter permease [Ktedonobacteraceae bacterium]